MIQWFRDLSANSIALLGIGVTIVLAVVAAAYAVGLAQGAKDLAEVEDFKKTLPPMMQNLQKLAGDLAQSTEMAEANKRMTAKADADSVQIKDLSQQLKDQEEKLSEQKKATAGLQAQLDKLVPIDEMTVTVAAGSAKRVIPNALTIGVTDVTNLFVEARVGTYDRTMHPGESVTETIGSRECRTELIQIGKSDATFVVSCLKRNAN